MDAAGSLTRKDVKVLRKAATEATAALRTWRESPWSQTSRLVVEFQCPTHIRADFEELLRALVEDLRKKAPLFAIRFLEEP
jgi:hypothetical protein